jgi:hypothetical protein
MRGTAGITPRMSGRRSSGARDVNPARPRHATAVRLLAALCAAALTAAAVLAQSLTDADIYTRIRQESAARSEIMRSLHMLTDVYGPRLTGSPNARAAGDWAMKTMTAWGLENVHAEAWHFDHPGWTNESVTAHITAPVKDQLTVEVVAWSPGTNGTVEAPVFVLTIPDKATASDLAAYLGSVDRQVAGRIVLVGRPAAVPVSLNQPPARLDESRLRAQYAQGLEPPGDPRSQAAVNAFEINRRIDEFLVKNGARLRINDAGRELGQIVAFNNPQYDVTKVVPTVVMRNEDYGRIFRILTDGTPVTLRFNIVNTVYPDGRTSYNTIAEIPGTDKAREVVMLGGHLDSWQSATGATDNAIGCAVMMEAARILKAIGVKPRRTIRVALWTGEEQGLLGSQAYVREHFGPFESAKPEHARLSAYLNLDTGTGRIRGATVFGPHAAADRVRDWLAPFADLGVIGAGATARRVLGLTDSGSFAAAGLPSLNFDQDPVQYENATHHTNLDTYERIIEGDARASSIVVAALIYQLAMHDDGLPRFDKKTMPSGNWR